MSGQVGDVHSASNSPVGWSSFRARGQTVQDWAKTRGFNPKLVYSILNGHRKCLRGQSHEIAVALGLKPAPGN